MSRILGYIVRLFVILLGYCAASLAGSAFIHLIFIASAGFDKDQMAAILSGSIIFSVPFVALFVAYFVFIPATVVIVIGEILSRRDWLYYALGGGVAAAVFIGFVHQEADPNFEVTNLSAVLAVIGGGIVGGYVYWLIAGRWASHWRSRPVPSDTTASGPTLPAP